MRLHTLTIFLFASALAYGNVLTLGNSAQTVTFTGTGVNANGAGTSRINWGSCSYDGTTTSCKVTGNYTGLGSGGTYTFLLTYPGNGASPLSAISSPIGSDQVIFNLTQPGSNLTFTITPTGGSPIQFYNLRFNVQFQNPTCTGVNACSVAPVQQSTGGTITGSVAGSFDATPVITTPNGLISASAYGGFTSIAPATWIEIYGQNLATVVSQVWGGGDFNGANAPTALGGTTVTVGGKPAYIDYVSPGQVNAQVPSGIGTGLQPVVVTTAGGASTAYMVNVNATEAGMLAPPAFKLAAGQYAVALFPNGATYVLPPGVTSAVPTARAKPGDIITLYGVGFGPVTPNINAGLIVQQANSLSGFTVSIGGTQAQVQFAGLVSGFLGLYQFNVVIPSIPANDATPMAFTVGGSNSTQQLLLAIGN